MGSTMGRSLPGSQIIDEGPADYDFRVWFGSRRAPRPSRSSRDPSVGQVSARWLHRPAPDCARAAERRRRVQDTYLCTY